LKLRFVLDDPETASDWSAIAVNTPVAVIGRLSIDEPNVITVRVRMAEASDGPPGSAPPSSDEGVPSSREPERR